MSQILVVGGGLAGGAAATLLARSGQPVRLIERNAGPKDKICGEFLSIEAQHHLFALGLDLDRMGAVHIDRVRLVSGRNVVESRLPFVGRGLSRRRLDEALLEIAADSGAEIERGIRVQEISGHAITTNAGTRTGRAVLLATGKLPVREEGQERLVPIPDPHVGFKMHWRIGRDAIPLLAGCIELTLFPGGYAGLQMVDANTANLCLIIRRSRLAALGNRWEDVLAMLAHRYAALRALADAEPLFDKPLATANLAYGRARYNDGQDGLYRLGDQAAMTASLTGDGMAIALRSAWLAARCVAEGRPTSDYHRQLHAMVRNQLRNGMLLQKLAESGPLRAIGLGLLRARPQLLQSVTRMTRLPDLTEDSAGIQYAPKMLEPRHDLPQ
jgi:flavin-dependent dehydrogenase